MAMARTKATEILHLFGTAVYFLPLLGGLLADRWLGRYWNDSEHIAFLLSGDMERWRCLKEVVVGCSSGFCCWRLARAESSLASRHSSAISSLRTSNIY